MSQVTFTPIQQATRLEQFRNDPEQRQKLLLATDALKQLGQQIADKVLDDTLKLVENTIKSGAYDAEGTQMVQFQEEGVHEYAKEFSNLTMRVTEQGVTELARSEDSKNLIAKQEILDAITKLAVDSLGKLVAGIPLDHSAIEVTGEASAHRNSVMASLTVKNTGGANIEGRLDRALSERRAELARLAEEKAAADKKAYEASSRGQGEFIYEQVPGIATTASNYWDSTAKQEVSDLLARLERNLGSNKQASDSVTIWISKDDPKWAEAAGQTNLNLEVHTDAESQLRRVDVVEKPASHDAAYHALALGLKKLAAEHASNLESPIGSFTLTSQSADRTWGRGFWTQLTFTAERSGDEPKIGTSIAPLPVKQVVEPTVAPSSSTEVTEQVEDDKKLAVLDAIDEVTK